MDSKIDKEIKKFIGYATEHGQALAEGNSIMANRIHGKITRLLKKQSFDLSKHDYLLDDVNHENVRLWVASELLKNGHIEAKETLEDLQMANSFVSMSAKIILDLYEKGMLTR